MTKGVPKLYKRLFTDVYFYGYISSLRDNLPTISIQKAILNFMNKHGYTDDDLSIETLVSTYRRMNAEYLDSLKTKTEA